MFVDEVDIEVQAGDGGNGCMAFRREKFVPRGGPSGGDGGAGGSVFLVASAHQNTLVNYRFHPEFSAHRGGHGEGSNCTGRDGEDLVLEVPPGTVAYDLGADHELIPLADLTEIGVRVLIAREGTTLERPYDINLWEAAEGQAQTVQAPVDPALFEIDPLSYL